jgi:hypothetical protein
MQLIQIGETQTAPESSTVTILQMFQQLADREARMINEARERVTRKIPTNG